MSKERTIQVASESLEGEKRKLTFFVGGTKDAQEIGSLVLPREYGLAIEILLIHGARGVFKYRGINLVLGGPARPGIVGDKDYRCLPVDTKFHDVGELKRE